MDQVPSGMKQVVCSYSAYFLRAILCTDSVDADTLSMRDVSHYGTQGTHRRHRAARHARHEVCSVRSQYLLPGSTSVDIGHHDTMRRLPVKHLSPATSRGSLVL